MIHTVDITKHYTEVNDMKKIDIEKYACEALLAFLLNHNQKESQDYFKLWQEYLMICKKHKQQKCIFFNTVVKQYIGDKDIDTWELAYDREALLLHEV